MIAAMDDDVGKKLAAARELAPFVSARQAVRADRGRRVAPLLAVRALLRHQLVGAAALPERLVELADRRLDRPRVGGGRGTGCLAHGIWLLVMARIGSLSEDHCARGIERHAAAGDEADFRIFDLPRPALAADLAHAFDHVQPALHVGFRKVAASRIDRNTVAVKRDAAAALHIGPGLSLLAEARMLQPEQ